MFIKKYSISTNNFRPQLELTLALIKPEVYKHPNNLNVCLFK